MLQRNKLQGSFANFCCSHEICYLNSTFFVRQTATWKIFTFIMREGLKLFYEFCLMLLIPPHLHYYITNGKALYLHIKYPACFSSWIKERDIFMCSALVSAHGIKESGYFAYRSRKIQVMAFVLRFRFQWLTNRLTTFPFVPMVPIDHSFSHGLQVLMRCSSQMVYRSTEELTIRSNGTNRKASLANRNLLPMERLVRVF